MPRPHRKGEFTCNCRAYTSRHRFGGGKCKGLWLAEEGFGSNDCRNCPLNTGSGCEVINDAESVKECRLYQKFVEFWEIKV
jgi:hypothetical protein